ncbi:MAG: dioxygenase [Acetobacteraceae bacterium]
MFTQANLNELRRTVRGLQTGSGDKRAVQIIDRLLDAVYPLIHEMGVTQAEWDAALRFLGETDPIMMRAIAWTLGLSQIVQENNSRLGEAATAECIEGPFHRPDAPIVANGAALHQEDDGGEYLFLEGRVLDTEGHPLAGAELDVWAANGEGNYSFFDPNQPERNCRGRLRSAADGGYAVFAPGRGEGSAGGRAHAARFGRGDGGAGGRSAVSCGGVRFPLAAGGLTGRCDWSKRSSCERFKPPTPRPGSPNCSRKWSAGRPSS